jgi:hypothetical protein
MIIRRLLRAPILFVLPAAVAVGACTEDLETGAACPTLCPGQELEIRDTVIDPAIVLDTVLGPFPLLGFEPALFLASRGDTLDVRAVVRFDTIARMFVPPGMETPEPVTFVDSATLTIRLARTALALPDSFFIDVYSVGDLSVPDSQPEGLIPLFTPDRLLGSIRVDSAGFADTTNYRIPLDPVGLLTVIGNPDAVLRIGLQVRGPDPVQVIVRSAEDAEAPPRLRYRVHADTAVPAASIPPTSSTPATPIYLAGDYIDHSIVVAAPDILAPGRFSIGGLPAVRSYLRFDLPIWLTDSTAILRARLELVQDPVRGLADADTVKVKAHAVLAGNAVTDLMRAAQLLAPEGFFIRDSLMLVPSDSGPRAIELNTLVGQWRSVDGVRPIPTAIVIRSTGESLVPGGVRFFGLGAPDPALRPRLRISYVPSIPFGRP